MLCVPTEGDSRGGEESGQVRLRVPSLPEGFVSAGNAGDAAGGNKQETLPGSSIPGHNIRQSFGTSSCSPVALEVPVQELGIAVQGAEVAEDGSLRASHVIHEHHGVGHVVQVHGHRDLDEAAQAGAPTPARFGHFQILTKVGREEVAAVRDSVG